MRNFVTMSTTWGKIFPLLLLFLLGFQIHPIDAGYPLKILGLFPHPGMSHFHFFHPIMRALAEAGHDVTVISPFPDKSPPVRYKDLPLTGFTSFTNIIDVKLFENLRFYGHFTEFFLLNKWGLEACNHTLKSSPLAEVLKRKTKYDVILLEQFNSDCMMGVAHILKAPVIALSSCTILPWHHERMGIPIIPSYMPALFVAQSEEMNFWGRLGNWISFHGLKLLYDFVTVPATDALLRYKFGHDLPSVRELAKETSLFFVNQHFSMVGAKPYPPSVIELGGIHIQKAKPLEQELQRFLDNAEHGVIFISWGSMVRTESLPAAKRDGILRAIKRLKQKVIWKWENDTLPDKPNNLYVSKWLPQRDILCHPNVKVFMTHGGLMGASEALYCGVPLVMTPFYGDQHFNVASLEHRGMGVKLPYKDISESTVFRAIKKVLDKPYMDNAKILSHSFKHRPQTALQTAIWWVEYVARTEGAPLIKSSAVYMSRFAYYSVDVYLFIASVLTISILSWIFVLSRLCSRSKKSQTSKVKSN